ncbi:MAG: hypothetical protein AAGB35_08150 [Pseudomonadota bacterium]
MSFKLNYIRYLAILFALLANFAYGEESQLASFELSGVVLNDKNSLAVLYNEHQGLEKVYREGDLVAGCVLDYIKRSGVSFYCNDQIYTLTLRGLTLEEASPVEEDVWSSPILITTQDQKLLFDNPSNFISVFNLTPYVKEGEFTAFEVKKVPEEPLSARFDLQEGDLIVGINGVSATSLDEFSMAIEQIKYTQAVDVELIRDGVRHHKSFMLNRSLADLN